MSDATRQDISIAEIADGTTGIWRTSSLPIASDIVGATFSYGVNLNAEGQNLNPPVPFTISDEPFYLKLYTSEVPPRPAYDVNIGARWEAAYGLYNGQLVWISTTMVLGDGVWAVEDDGTFSITEEIFFDTIYSASGSTKNQATMYDKVRSTIWDGYLQFSIATTSGTVPITNVTLSGWSVPFNTGWEGHTAYEGRPVWDMKTGLPTFAQDCTEDGYYYGIWTAANSWDADYPPNLQPVELPDSEGEIDDDYPQ